MAFGDLSLPVLKFLVKIGFQSKVHPKQIQITDVETLSHYFERVQMGERMIKNYQTRRWLSE